MERGAPLADPERIAARARAASGVDVPAHVLFEWEYVDERGNLRGEGAARVNPPDRFRLDLFTTGDGSMSVVLVDDRLSTGGVLEEDIRLPPEPFLYAMTGIFRPGGGPPAEGFESDGFQVLGYGGADGAMRYYYLSEGRLVRAEERRAGRTARRIEIEWGEDATWPGEARYRDEAGPSAVRWSLVRSRTANDPWPEDIYALPGSP
ncbi:MAG: hypothetical protein R3266_09825 [Gemmatimonadota bacterium]|nr:hypothetical protein [Gemmatimonadota bacterium]